MTTTAHPDYRTKTHTVWLDPVTGKTVLVPHAFALDERDCDILRARSQAWQARPGPRVGDYVVFGNGEMRRFAHDWEEYGLQTTTAADAGSFYLGESGYCDMSGSLEPCVRRETLSLTGEKPGLVWFFHHGDRRAHNGVNAWIPCRVFTSSDEAPPR